jgi:formylmethanofuran dehydrogenase subunit D
MPQDFILIPGRTSKQGVGISEGKFKEGYRSETRTLQVAPKDMQRLGIKDGDEVRLTSEWGQITVAVVAAKADELPPGLLFIAYGDLSSQLMGGDTHGSGMPTSKGIDVKLEVQAPNPKPQTPNPKPQTPNPKPLAPSH